MLQCLLVKLLHPLEDKAGYHSKVPKPIIRGKFAYFLPVDSLDGFKSVLLKYPKYNSTGAES